MAMAYLVETTKANDKELFSICMDFWHEFTKGLYVAGVAVIGLVLSRLSWRVACA